MSSRQSTAMLALPSVSTGDGRALAENEGDAGVLVDALPYLDTNYTEADRQMALQLIESECRTFRPTKNYLKFLPPPDLDAFLTPCMIKEHARMAKKQEMPKLDMSRCELSCPSTTGRQGDKTSWRKAIRNAAAQNEHLRLRNLNLQLMEEYAPETMLRFNKNLEDILHSEEKQLRKMREEVMNIHALRRDRQVEAGRKLKELEQRWVEMVTKNYKMELACGELATENETRAKKAKLI
uniref:Pre-mRNA-splicing factor SPF27 n=1 Tax=Parascaris univalens TaxID=6257 RepID=A0A915AIG4_PARUN